MALVGSYVGLSKLLVLVFPVFLLAWLRFGIAAVAMAHWVRRAPGEAPLSRARPPAAVLGIVLRQLPVLDLHAVRRGADLGAGRRRDHGRACPAVVALLSWALAARAHHARAWRPASPARWPASRWCRSPGTADGRRRAGSLLGNLLLLGAVICEAIYVVIGKKLTGQRLAQAHQRADQPVGPGAGHAASALWQALSFDFGACRRRLLGAAGVLFARRQHGHRVAVDDRAAHVPASSAGVFTVMLPVSAAAVGVLFLGERFSAAAGGGLRAGAGRRGAGHLAGTRSAPALQLGAAAAACRQRLRRRPRRCRRPRP